MKKTITHIEKLLLVLGIVFVGDTTLHAQKKAKETSNNGDFELTLKQLMNVEITTARYLNVDTNLRFNNLFKTKFYFNIHAINLLNKVVYYPPTFTNSSYLPNGTYDSGTQLSAAVSIKF